MSSDNWNDRIKAAVEALESNIPYIGAVVNALTELLWPASEENVWDQIREQVTQLVDSKILAKELEDREEELDGLKDTMNDYVAAKSHEKGALMATMLNEANILYHELTQSSNKIHLIPLSIVAAHMHLTFLRERRSHGKEMYDEDNTPEWQEELITKYNEYRKFFRDIYPSWNKWRASQIEATWYTTKIPATIPPFFSWVAHGDVRDHITGYSMSYEKNWDAVEETFKDVCLAIKEQKTNEVVADMAGTLVSTFFLHRYMPGREKDPADVDPALSAIWLGPYSMATLGVSMDGPCSTDREDTPGSIKQIYVREWNSIDGLQFIYSDHDGQFIGDPNGGAPHRIDIGNNRHCTGLRMRFANGIMCCIEIVFSDKSSSGNLGNRNNWSGQDVDATVDASYKLASGNFRQGSGPSGTVGTSVIKLQFQFSLL